MIVAMITNNNIMLKYTTILFCFMCMFSCTHEDSFLRERHPLVLQLAGTKAASYDSGQYFSIDGMSDASVETLSEKVIYTYADGRLSAKSDDDMVFFPVDGSSLPYLKISWPESGIRESMPEVPYDQSEKEVFLKADWLSAELTEVAMESTVPVILEHERALVSFYLTGQFDGRKIVSLYVGDFNAFCDVDPEIVQAQLILNPDEGSIMPGSVGALYMDGDDSPYNFTIESFPGLEPGKENIIRINL